MAVKEVIRMKTKRFLIICGVIMFGIMVFICGWSSAHYTIKAQVIESKDATATAFKDSTGNIWTIDKDNYTVGENVLLTFNCNYTESDRTDDIITKVQRR